MRVQYVGFNLFGLVSENQSLIKSFTEFNYDSLKSLHLAHTFGIVQNDSVFLHGYFSEKTHQKVEIKVDKVIKKILVFDSKVIILYENGQIAQVDVDGDLKPEEVPIKIDDGDSIIDMAVGANFIIALTKEGYIYNLSKKLDFINKGIIQIVTGREHCLLLDKDGNVYSFGIGSKGQLGHGDLSNKENPVQIEALGGIKIKKIAAGGWHSCALSESGDLYTWGWNQDNQLGLFESDDGEKKAVVGTPEAVNFPVFEVNVEDVACGTRHTVALLGNKIYGVGMNKYFQLGNNMAEDETPMKFLYEANGKVLGLTCGPWSTAILMSDDPPEVATNQ